MMTAGYRFVSAGGGFLKLSNTVKKHCSFYCKVMAQRMYAAGAICIGTSINNEKTLWVPVWLLVEPPSYLHYPKWPKPPHKMTYNGWLTKIHIPLL